MHPVVAEFGEYKIYGYGLMILIGVVFSWYYAYREFKKYGLKSTDSKELRKIMESINTMEDYLRKNA